MRVQSNVKSLTELDCDDKIINYTPAQRKGEEPVKVRVVHVTLDDGTDECLVTNLMDPSITPEMLKKLYFLRWGVMPISELFSLCRLFINADFA